MHRPMQRKYAAEAAHVGVRRVEEKVIPLLDCKLLGVSFMINRLLGIIYILMNRGTVTATELAQHFEVSVRTIYRDIESLSIAGIPVYTKKEKNGGLCLTEQFVLNKMLITNEEQQQILSALVSVQETGALAEQKILQKLGEFFRTEPVNWLAIDLSDWSGTRKQLYEDIKIAILTRRAVQFDYYGQNSTMQKRIAEPIQLIFKEYTWYLKAFCRERQAVRLFKLFRMKRFVMLEEIFAPQDEHLTEEKEMQEMLPSEREDSHDDNASAVVMLWIDKKEAYRVYDRFDESELQILEDGNFLVHLDYKMDDWVYGMILSFGVSAKVLAPESVKQEIKRRIGEMWQQYQE